MRLGTSSPLNHSSAEEWAKNQIKLGCSAVVFPLSCNDSKERIDEYKEVADKYNLTIAEVGIWRNVLSKDSNERKANIEYCIKQLKLADYLNAKCAVNVAGSMGQRWDGGYRENFTDSAWKETVSSVRKIIDEADVKNTFFTLEPMPWMYPTGPEEYLKLLEDVDRDRFGVHMDIINMINSAERYFKSEDFIDECIKLLGDKIKSCHIKDIHFIPEYTFQVRECAPGEGEFPIRRYVERINEVNPDMPMILEHLNTDEEYIKYMTYLKEELYGLYKTL